MVPSGTLSTYLLAAPIKVMGKTCSMTTSCDTLGIKGCYGVTLSHMLRRNAESDTSSLVDLNVAAQGCKNVRKMKGNPSGSDQIPSKNHAVVAESIVIHTPSELQSILCQPFNVSDSKVNHLGGLRILFEYRNEKEGHHSSTNCLESEMSAQVDEKLEHVSDLGSDRIDLIIEGGFSSNCGELREQLNPNVEEVFTNDVVQQQDPSDDNKDVKSSNPEIDGKVYEIIYGSPITTGLVGVLLSHNGDGDNHGDDGFGDVEGAITENKAPHDDDTSDATRKFFALPAEEKLKYSKEKSVTNNIRFGTSFTPEAEKALEWKDYLSLFLVSDDEAATLWPSVCRNQALEYIKSSKLVIKKLLMILMNGLNLKEIDEAKESKLMGSKRINLNYYPKCPNPELTVGVGRHSDVSTLTILLQDEIGGLYVRNMDTMKWIHIPPVSGSLLLCAKFLEKKKEASECERFLVTGKGAT
nr:feruloyl CoA ortho-hydroxylase 1-like [Tanacetum cinerariifolium]